jgi:hypothetical protein
MTPDGWRVADSDMHIFEPPDLWQRRMARSGSTRHRSA